MGEKGKVEKIEIRLLCFSPILCATEFKLIL